MTPWRKLLTISTVLLIGAVGRPALPAGPPADSRGYVCPPCYHVESLQDAEIHDRDGKCPVCGMQLVERRTLLDADQVDIHAGSGNFLLRNGIAHPDKPVFVFYHRPGDFDADSPVLIVVPGAGRDAWEYRDAWIEASEEHGILVLAPMYDDGQYDFAAYHMGGIITELELRNVEPGPDGEAPSEYHLGDDDIVFEVNDDSSRWIFRDFDLIFRKAVEATGSTRPSYDIFGHSAGGQILHRMAIFHTGSHADRIVAGNSGFYTLPDHDVPLPFGVGGSAITTGDLASAFSKNLVLLLGELDNASETRGTMLHTPTADRQGQGRLSRGQYFYRESRRTAESSGMPFNWRIEIVDGVGHDHRLMGKAAAELLYADTAGNGRN